MVKNILLTEAAALLADAGGKRYLHPNARLQLTGRLRGRAAALLAWLRAGQLGPGYVSPRNAPPPSQEHSYFHP